MGALPATQCSSCQSRVGRDDLQDAQDEPTLVDDDAPLESSGAVVSEAPLRLSLLGQARTSDVISSAHSDAPMSARGSTHAHFSSFLESPLRGVASAHSEAPAIRAGSAGSVWSMSGDRATVRGSWYQNWSNEDIEDQEEVKKDEDNRNYWRSTFWRASRVARASVARLFRVPGQSRQSANDPEEQVIAPADCDQCCENSNFQMTEAKQKAKKPELSVDVRKRALADALRALCKKHGLCCGIVWTHHAEKSNVLVVDIDASYPGTAPGYFAAAAETEFALARRDSIATRVYANKANELIPNVYYLGQESCACKHEALHDNIRTMFCIWGNDDLVYEFGTSKEMWKLPFEAVDVEAINAEALDEKLHRPEDTQLATPLTISHDDLEALCEKHELCCCIVWIMQRRGVLTVDKDASFTGTAPEFVERSSEIRLPVGHDIPGRVWQSKSFEHEVNVQHLSLDAYARLNLAKQHGIRTCYAMYQDNRLYEFYAAREMNSCPFQTLQGK